MSKHPYTAHTLEQCIMHPYTAHLVIKVHSKWHSIPFIVHYFWPVLLGSIQTPWRFHILIRYSLILKLIKFKCPSSIYTQYPIMAKRKQDFRHFANVLHIQIRNTLFRPFAMRLEIELRFIVFPLIFLEMSKALHLSARGVTTVPGSNPGWFESWFESTCGIFNWLDMIWKGTHLSI
jgi:hypothetical protein